VSSGPTVWDKIRQLNAPHDKQAPVGAAKEGATETSHGLPPA
jgi:hypothetical protein